MTVNDPIGIATTVPLPMTKGVAKAPQAMKMPPVEASKIPPWLTVNGVTMVVGVVKVQAIELPTEREPGAPNVIS